MRTIFSEAITAAFGLRPHAEPFVAKPVVALLGWDTVARLLCDGADLLVADRGAEVDLPPPRSIADARHCLAAGASLVVRRAERHDAALHALAGDFEAHFGGRVHVQIFVTPPGGQTFGWHFDDEHVFILQTQGAKHYWFRENTVWAASPPVDFTAHARETSPPMKATLVAGDLLYLPLRWWHVGRAADDCGVSMHLSVGVDTGVG